MARSPVISLSGAGADAPGLPEQHPPNWALLALLLSLVIHGALYFVFHGTQLSGFKEGPAERLVSRPFFTGARVELPENIFDEPKAQPTPEVKSPSALIPNAPEQFEPPLADTVISPVAPDLTKVVPAEVPRPETNLTDLAKLQQSSAGSLEKESAAIQEQLIKVGPHGSNAPQIDLTKQAAAGTGQPGTGSDDASIPGLSNLDDLLGKSGPLTSGTAPIGMKGGTLYEYDSADLRPDGIEQLKKLGALIQKNPQASFSIEGHTDSFGSTDYNNQLSLRRAESVKAWLVQNMGIDPNRVQTRGFGSTKLLVPAVLNGRPTTVDEQQNNRRVEIVIKIKKG